uniref:Phosphatase tensin-type domain-containing protein n=1 Tax=Globodera pallida TaxID=36090 RepID=A0A183CE83_GLOPA
MLCFGTKKEEEEEEGEGDGVEEEDRRHLRRRRRRSMPKSEGDEPNNGREWAWTNGGTVTKRKKLKKRRKSKTKHHNSDMDTEQKQLAHNGQREMEKRMPNGNNGREKCSSSGPLIGTAEGGIEFAKITDRIFALLYPSGSDNLYRQNIKLVSDRIKRIFQDRYKIFNLSQKRSDLGRANSQGAVVELGWPDTLAPPLDRLCSICKQIENYLSADAENVTIIHCKGGLYRAGIVVAAFMHYSSISERDANVADRFSMKLFTEKFLGYDAQPSHKRYVSYFANLLSGSVKVYPSPIFLSQLSLSRIFPGRLVTLKLYERMKPIWSSGKIFLGEHSAVGLPDGALSLRGDVLLKCCVPSSDGLEKQLLFQCQFNTCALNLDALDSPKLNLYKEELDYLFDGQFVDSSASLELAFELVDPQPPVSVSALNNNNNVTTKQPQQRKSASPARTGSAGPTTAAAGGDFSRVDSYENFERAEDERSLSLPISNVVPKDDVIVNAEVRGEGGGAAPFGVQQQQQPLRHPSPRIRSKSQTNHHQLQQQQKEEQQNQAVSATQPAVTTDGADSGIGSDSPKAQPQPLNPIEKMAEGTSTSDKFATANRKMPPPPVPPKSRRNSSMDLDDFEPDDPMRSAYEDSTIGRDHSVLPPGARPALSRRHSAQGADGTPGGSSGDEKATAPETTTTTTKKVCPMVQPELVAMGRYDPNSRCFSYVPVKALKEHYSAPKKPAPVLKRRISVVDDLDSPASPTEAQLALQNLGHKGSNGDVRRRAETPKWETEIDKVTGRVEPLPERRPRRASASFTPVGQLQPDEVRSPSAQVRSPHEEWRLRQRHQQQRRTEPLEAALNECYERRFIAGREESRPETREGTRTSVAHTVPRAQTPREALAHAERPLVVDQAKRATPVPAHHSAHVGHQPPLGLRLSSSVPAPSKLSPRSNGRQEMDTLCDPNFYLSYSTPKAAEKGPKKKAAQAQPPYGDLLSKSMPPNDPFRPTKNELMRDDVRDLLKHHQLVTSPHRSQTPQTLDIGRNRRFGAAPSIQQDEFRRRNCRSVNSTPLIGSRKLFLHGTEDSFGSDSDARRGAEDWLNAKLRAVKGKRYMPEAEEQWKNAERLLLEELKQKSTGAHEPRGGGDPLEEYRREEQRLKNTHSPLVMDNPLRMANKNLQKERARHFLLNQPLQTIEPFRTFPSPQRSPPPFGNLPLSITTASSPQNENFLQKDQSRPLHQQPNRNVESPILQPIRRGATPTSQIVRGKPPTPPPLLSREDRARSKSPYALKFLRGNSSSAPPATAAAKKGQQNQTQERRESNPMVNPQLYALRQSLYAKERQRIGDGRETDEAFADREQFAVAGREEGEECGSGKDDVEVEEDDVEVEEDDVEVEEIGWMETPSPFTLHDH